MLVHLWNRWIDYTVKREVPFVYYIATFFAVVVVRIFLELFSDRGVPRFPIHFHYLLFYVSTFMAVAVVITFFVKDKPEPVLTRL